MGISKIKFLREGKGKIGLKGKSYSFRRLKENTLSAPFKNRLLGKTKQSTLSSFHLKSRFISGFQCMTEINSFMGKLKDPILEYFRESFDETGSMEKTTIRNRSLLIIPGIFKHENPFHLVGSKLLVTELLKLGSTYGNNTRIVKDLKSTLMLYILSLMVSLGGPKQICEHSYKSWRTLQELISDQWSS
jgi:hypothetical protein